jgi:hypothetical protein
VRWISIWRGEVNVDVEVDVDVDVDVVDVVFSC